MIPWPWLSNAHRYAEREEDLLTARARCAALEAHVEMAQHNLAEMRKLYDELLAKYHTLKIVGATGPDSTPAPMKAERDIVLEAILVRAGTNVHLRRHYAEYVTFQRAAGIADVEIAAGILEGESDEDGVP